MTKHFEQPENVTAFHPALIALRARLADAELACFVLSGILRGPSQDAAEFLAVLHRQHGTQLEQAAGPRGIPKESVSENEKVDEMTKMTTGAAALEGGILPAALAVLEDRVVSSLDRAIALNHPEPIHSMLVEMRADLADLHTEIGHL